MMDIDLTKGKINTHIKNISIPASIGMLFNTLFNVVDTIFGGKISTNALAGMSLSFPIFFIVISLSSGIGTGSTALISNALGEKDTNKYNYYGYNGLVIGIFFSIVITILGKIISPYLFTILSEEKTTYIYGIDYINIIFYGSIFFVLNAILNAMLSSQGDTRSYRNFLIIGFLLNLLLDPLFILGWVGLPRLGTMGIALATVIVQFVGTIYLAYRVYKSQMFDIKEFLNAKFSIKVCIEILKQGIPASLNMMTIALGVFVINYFASKYGGDVSVAAYGAAVRIEQLALLPALGLNTAALTISGQNYGGKEYGRIIEVYKRTLLYGVTIMTIGMVIIYPLADILVSIFTDDLQLINIGTEYLRIEFWAFNTYVLLNISISILQGMKKPFWAIYVGLYRQILMPIIVFYAFGTLLGMGIYGVWWGIVVINWSAAIITVLYTLYKLIGLKKEIK